MMVRRGVRVWLLAWAAAMLWIVGSCSDATVPNPVDAPPTRVVQSPSSTVRTSVDGSATSTEGGVASTSRPVTASRPPSATSSPPPAQSAPAERTASPQQISDQVTARMRDIAKHEPAGSISVAAVNTATGRRYSFGAAQGMWTASAYKLLVLEGLLLERQRTGAWLTAGEIADATRAIENSDNVAGYRLFLDMGGRSGLTRTIQQLGMTHTVAGRTDPTFTTTGGQDCLAMARALLPGGPLDARSRSFVLGLMSHIESDQRWGIGVIAGPGDTFVNKNGWLPVQDDNGPGETDGGRWVVTSVGIVTEHEQHILIAVLTQHQPSLGAGQQLVETLARLVEPVVSQG
ncbi:MAG: hypothetical protein J0I11_18915 [Actinobacteria bacterium]|nr:hypothetical protein [Actinomycetota bacterium]